MPGPEQLGRERLRICVVSREEPGATGTSRYADQLYQGLRDRGHDVVPVVAGPGPRAEKLLVAAGRPLGVDASAFLGVYPAFLRWPQADVYHLTAHTFASALRATPPPGPVVVTVHDIGRLLEGSRATRAGIRSRLLRRAERFALVQLRRADHLIAVSGWTKQTIVREIRVAEDAVTVTPLGVDHGRYRPIALPADFRRRFRLADDRRYLLCVGSEEPRKNLPTVWRALRTVTQRFPDVVLLKVGRGYDGRERERLRSLAAELGIERAIILVDHVPEDDLPLFYNAADMLLMPSFYEGFGLPALEAMACGTPVVTSDRAALPELVGGGTGLQVDPADAESLATAITTLLEDPAGAKAVGERGHRRAQGFTWQRMVDRTIDVYRQVTQGSRSDRRRPGRRADGGLGPGRTRSDSRVSER